jgi:hypothetical protein
LPRRPASWHRLPMRLSPSIGRAKHRNWTPTGYEVLHDAPVPPALRVAARQVQRQAREAYRLFRQNAAHPGLHFKRVFSDPPMYSARVGIGYRAVGVLDGDIVTWFWIGSHVSYDQLLGSL